MGFRTAMHNHRYMLSVCMAYMVVVMVVSYLCGVQAARFWSIVGFFCLLPLFYVPVLMAVCFGKAALSCKSFGKVFRETERYWDEFVSSQQAKDGFAGLLAIVPLLVFFCIIKSLFPVLATSSWDMDFAQMDLLIHGVYPHEFFVPFVMQWNLEGAVEQAYVIWFLFMFMANFYSLFFDRDPIRRKQYLWSFILCWIASGTVLALAFYSAGPVFYHLVYPDAVDPYKDLVLWLSTADKGEPANSFRGAMYLYEVAMDEFRPDFNGPSAMPSQHVGVAWLIALYAFRIKPVWGWVMSAYTAIIFISSVVLGWHYAIDGYAGIVLVTIIWVIVGFFLKRCRKIEGDNVQAG